MKTIAFLVLVAVSPATGVTDPEYGCDLEKRYCVVKLEAWQELMQSQKRECAYYES